MIEREIRQFLNDNVLFYDDAQGDSYADDDSFIDEGIIDSMGVMELVMFVEEQYGVAIADHEITLENFDSIDRLARFVRGKRASHVIQHPARRDSA